MPSQFTDKYQLSKVAYDALQRIKENKALEAKQVSEQKTPKKVDYSLYIFEEYSDDTFASKIKLDSYIYKKFLSQLEEEQHEHASKLLSELLENVKAIYEHINIEPKVHGFKNVSLESSENLLISEANRLTVDFFSKNYYNLTESQRQEKYSKLIVESSYELMIAENLSIEESVDHSYKTILMSNYIRSINFPYIIESKINELIESDMYKEMFDSETLISLVENFKENNLKLSRVLALLV